MTTRTPHRIEGYSLGDEGKPEHFDAGMSRKDASDAAAELRVNDAAFIKRSDLKWTYAIISEMIEDGVTTLRFDVDTEKNRKSFPQNQWGKYIRVIKPEARCASPEPTSTVSEVKTPGPTADTTAEPINETGSAPIPSTPTETATSDADAKKTPRVSNLSSPNVAKELPPPVPKPAPSNKKQSGGLFSYIFGGRSSPTPEAASSPTDQVATTPAVAPAAPPVTTPVSAPPSAPASSPAAVPAAVPKTTPEAAIVSTPTIASVPAMPPTPATVPANETPSANSALKTVDFTSASNAPPPINTGTNLWPPKVQKPPTPLKKVPSSILKSMIPSKKTKDATPLNAASPNAQEAAAANKHLSPPLSPVDARHSDWKDALECDYEKNPSAMFQALEAKQFNYVVEMFRYEPKLAEKECKTWVVSRAVEDKLEIRFRALPLHAAVFFGAPEELTLKILETFPIAARGRDAKGRLPLHLAFEHDASDKIVCTLIETFPKGFYAQDKMNKTCLDYVNPNSEYAFRAKFIPKLLDFSLEEERARWEIEMENNLITQKEDLKKDADFVEEVAGHVAAELHEEHLKRIKMLETQHEKDILYIRKKHADETEALLEGFEVKLNFEKKLRSLRS